LRGEVFQYDDPVDPDPLAMAGLSHAIIHFEPEEMQMIETIVIGAGVMGASVAYRLAQAGAAVTVLEATRIGAGTSGISFAWTNAHKKPPKPYHDLNVAGMKAHAALADEFGGTP
jgi:glycine/D-amino acid oxidase-like deaminating enzyme